MFGCKKPSVLFYIRWRWQKRRKSVDGESEAGDWLNSPEFPISKVNFNPVQTRKQASNLGTRDEDHLVVTMKIDELIIDGFKSYAVRTTIDKWDPTFNAITVYTLFFDHC